MKNISKKKNMSKDSKILEKIKNNANIKYKAMEKILDNTIQYTIQINKKDKTMSLFHENKKILTGKFNFYGIIRPNGIFLWSFMIPGIDKRILDQVNKVKSFSHLFENSSDKDMLLYKSFLDHDSILINEEEQKKLLDLILYLGNDIYYFVQTNKDGNLQLIYLSEITEQYV